MGIPPLTFTGVSKFSDDFQTIVSRSVAIASLPVKALQNDQIDLLAKKQLWTALRTDVEALAGSLSALGTLAGNKSLASSSSNSSKASASVASGAQAGIYVLSEISSVAAPASSISTLGLASPATTDVSGAGDYLQLVVGNKSYDLDLSGGKDNLNSIRDTINNLNAGLSASIINANGNYFLSLSATSPGAKSIALRTVKDDSGTNILTTLSAGADSTFKINGQSVTQSATAVTGVIPGVTINLLNTTSGAESVTLTVAPSRTPVTEALSDFASKYNALIEKFDAQSGEAAGLLQGDTLMNGLRNRVRSMTSYLGEGAVSSLGDLGIRFDQLGRMSLDSSVVEGLSDGDLLAAFDFIGSSTTGLAAWGARLTEYSDPLTGLIRLQQADYDTVDTRITKQIATMSERIAQMQSTLVAQLQAADALLASLEGQQGLLTATIDSLNVVSYGRRDG